MPHFHHDTTVRVRYAETDQMGYVYYGNYATYFEVGRVEALRELGFPYKKLEQEGVLLPVRTMQVRYRSAAKYDDLLTVRTIVEKVPSVSIEFRYEVMDELGKLLTEGSTQLVFVDAGTGQPRSAPDALLAKLQQLLSA